MKLSKLISLSSLVGERMFHSHSHAKHASFLNFNTCICPFVHGFLNHSTANVAAWSSTRLVRLQIKHLWISWGGFQRLDFGEKSVLCICSVGKSFCNLDSDALENNAAKYPSIPSCVQKWSPLDWFIRDGADLTLSEVNLPLSYSLFLPFSLSNLWHGFLLKLDEVPLAL